jgi:cytochrome P450
MEEATRRHGDCFVVRFPQNPPFVFLSNPELIRQVFTGKPEDLLLRPVNRVTEPLLGKNSLVLLDGEEHIRERRLMTPPFHGERMLSYGRAMRAAADRAIDRWPLDRAFSLHGEFQRITLDIILETVFGLSEGETFAHFRELFVRLLNVGSHPAMLFLSATLPASRVLRLLSLGSEPLHLGPLKADVSRALPWTQLSRLMREVDAYLFAEFARRRAEGLKGREDVLSMLMQARDEDGQPMSDQELRDEAITLLTAGHETTATALAWTFHHVLQRPEVEQKLRAELDGVAGSGPVEPGQVNRLEYVDATLKEAMRLLPVVPLVGRVLRRPMKLGPWEVPAGMAVLPCIYLTQRRADLWPEPTRFEPERFLGRRLNPYEYFPFGGGARRCLGMAFASYEMKIVFAQVLQRVRLRAATRYSLQVRRRAATLAQGDGVPVLVESRAHVADTSHSAQTCSV